MKRLLACLVLIFCAAPQAGLAADQEEKRTWLAEDGYPPRALREGREGDATFRVLVGIDGRAKDCVIVSSSGHADLDEATCANVVRRARFRPANDDQGNPIESYFQSTTRWRIR